MSTLTTSPSIPATPAEQHSGTGLADPHRVGPANVLTCEEILERVQALPVWSQWSLERQRATASALGRVLTVLAASPGHGWQQRWVASGVETRCADTDWHAALEDPALSTASMPSQRTRQDNKLAVSALMLVGAVLPGYRFLTALRASWTFLEARTVLAPESFARVEQQAAALGLSARTRDLAMLVLTKMVLHTGVAPDQLGVTELDAFHRAEIERIDRVPPGLVAAWDLLRGCGQVPAELGYRDHQRTGQRSTTELVDRYQLRCTPVRDALVRYLDDRRPALDYKSFCNIVGHLVGAFWKDIETHHPEIDSLLLPDDVAAAWKQRLRFTRGTKSAGRPRRDYLQHLMQVRAFYLDIQEWALHDPTWAEHAVRCPINRAELKGVSKQRKQTIAAVHQRIRERLPQLPTLIDTAYRHFNDRNEFLASARATPVDHDFEHHGQRFRRTGPTKLAYRSEPGRVLAYDHATGNRIDLSAEEDDAFWAWVVVEVLRHTGARLEELLELSHFALVQHRLEDSGEVVPLLQVLPSKTDHERLLLVTPELASVLARIISRLRAEGNGHIPLTRRWDRHERTYSPALPHLFQRRHGHRHRVISVAGIQSLLNRTLARSGLLDRAGEPLRFTPHDFRRIFATDAVSGGLPVHITARILGHNHINSSEAYLAVYQDELIRTYRSYLNQRRTIRPETEYRDPTDDEWREFQQHFALRKLELGTCARPYGTPCRHEHACLRCPMLQVDPRQRDRLAEITNNLRDRIDEAQHNGWLGEIEGLRISLRGAEEKLVALDRKPRANTDLGMPAKPG